MFLLFCEFSLLWLEFVSCSFLVVFVVDCVCCGGVRLCLLCLLVIVVDVVVLCLLCFCVFDCGFVLVV